MRSPRALALSFALVAALSSATCLLSRHRNRAPPAGGAPLSVQFAGCAAVDRGPICEVPSTGRLHLWIGAAGPLRVATERGPIAHEVTGAKDGGLGVDVAPPPDARTLSVTLTDGRVWSLALVRATERPWLEEASRLRDEGDLERARALLLPFRQGPGDADRARAEGLLARIELARGDYEAAVVRFRDAITRDHAAGLLSSEVDDTFALTFTLDQRLRRYSEARAALGAVAAAAATYPEGWARLPFYEGVLLDDTIDPHSALERFAEAQRRAALLGMRRLERNARSSYALELAAIGRRAEALTELGALEATSDDGPPCDRADLLDAIGIWTLRSVDASSRGAEEHATLAKAELAKAEGAFAKAAALYPRACGDLHRHHHVLLGLAEVALRENDLGRARARLAETRNDDGERSPSLDVAALDFEARLALAEGSPRASLDAYEAQERAAGGVLPPDLAYAHAAGRGEALEALGRPAEALAEYERAERLLDEQSLEIPLSEGRLSFLADRQRSARDRIALLLSLGRAPEAMAAARASRVRAVAACERGHRLPALDEGRRAQWEGALESYRRLRDRIDARAEQDWRLPADGLALEREHRAETEAQLRVALDKAFAVFAGAGTARAETPAAPAEGELLVVYHPLRVGWAGFGALGDAVTAFRFALPDGTASPEDLSGRLLEPLRVPLAAARRVRVLASGALRALDFHALPFGEGMLLDRAVVTYGTDRPAQPEPSAPEVRRALIVADPADDLRGTHEEADLVARAIAAAPSWQTQSLVRDDATSVRVRALLPSASWFHYAGHGSFDPRHELGSALLLASGTTLTVGDILAMTSAPAFVVLSGCDAGRSDDDDDTAEGLGLAQAFVQAGARVAVAPSRRVHDRDAARLASLLYADFGGREFDLARALRDAQRTMRTAAPSSDWRAFRAVTP